MKKLILFFIVSILFATLLSAEVTLDSENSVDSIIIEKSETMLLVTINGRFEDGFSPLVQIDADNNAETGDNGFEYAVDSDGSLSRWDGMSWCYIEDAEIEITDKAVVISLYLDDLYDPVIGGVVNMRVKGLGADGSEVNAYNQHVDISNGSDSMVSELALKLHSVDTLHITDTAAEIKWKTTRYSTGYVEYGKSAYYGKNSEEERAYGKKHSIELSGLKPNTLYHYRVVSEADDGRIVKSNDMTFRTGCKTMPESHSSSIGRLNILIEDNLLTLEASGLFQNGFLPLIGIDADSDANTGNNGSEYQISENGAISKWENGKWIYLSDASIELLDDKVTVVALLGDFNAPVFAATVLFSVGGSDATGEQIEAVTQSITWRENTYLDEQSSSDMPVEQEDNRTDETIGRIDTDLSPEGYLWRELGDIYASSDEEISSDSYQYREETEELMAAARRGVRVYESYYSGGFRMVDSSDFGAVTNEGLGEQYPDIVGANGSRELAYGADFNVLQNAYSFHYKKAYNLSDHIYKSKVYVADYSRGLRLIDVRDKYKRESSYGIKVTTESIPDIYALLKESKVYTSDYSQGLKWATATKEKGSNTSHRRYTASAYGLLEDIKSFSRKYSRETQEISITPMSLALMMKRIDENNSIHEGSEDDGRVYAVDYSRGLKIFEIQKKRTLYAYNIIYNTTKIHSTQEKKKLFYKNKYSFNIV